jgi:hypothetical protein
VVAVVEVEQQQRTDGTSVGLQELLGSQRGQSDAPVRPHQHPDAREVHRVEGGPHHDRVERPGSARAQGSVQPSPLLLGQAAHVNVRIREQRPAGEFVRQGQGVFDVSDQHQHAAKRDRHPVPQQLFDLGAVVLLEGLGELSHFPVAQGMLPQSNPLQPQTGRRGRQRDTPPEGSVDGQDRALAATVLGNEHLLEAEEAVRAIPLRGSEPHVGGQQTIQAGPEGMPETGHEPLAGGLQGVEYEDNADLLALGRVVADTHRRSDKHLCTHGGFALGGDLLSGDAVAPQVSADAVGVVNRLDHDGEPHPRPGEGHLGHQPEGIHGGRVVLCTNENPPVGREEVLVRQDFISNRSLLLRARRKSPCLDREHRRQPLPPDIGGVALRLRRHHPLQINHQLIHLPALHLDPYTREQAAQLLFVSWPTTPPR